jgi:hypothetical protein
LVPASFCFALLVGASDGLTLSMVARNFSCPRKSPDKFAYLSQLYISSYILAEQG